MKQISTTIKRKYMNKIMEGTKKIEYKADIKFWNVRLSKLVDVDDDMIIINFLCGRKSYKYYVIEIKRCFSLDGIIFNDKFHYWWWEIHLGPRISR